MSRKYRSPPMTEKMAAIIKWLLSNTDLAQHQIAAKFGVNQGRVSEINTGQRFTDVVAIDPGDLDQLAA